MTNDMDNKDALKPNEFLCPTCGAILTDEERTENGWNCKCGEFIPEKLAVNSYEGLSNQHKQNRSWR
jgi:hypothetical protein